MAAVTREPAGHAADIIHRTTAQNLVVFGLIAWAAIGPILFIFYGYHVNGLLWGELAAVPADRADDIRAAYYADAMIVCLYGAAAWIAGLIVLAVLALRNRAHR